MLIFQKAMLNDYSQFLWHLLMSTKNWIYSINELHLHLLTLELRFKNTAPKVHKKKPQIKLEEN